MYPRESRIDNICFVFPLCSSAYGSHCGIQPQKQQLVLWATITNLYLLITIVNSTYISFLILLVHAAYSSNHENKATYGK